MRTVFFLAALMCTPRFHFAQDQQPGSPTIPAERRADSYAVYSAVMAQPRLSHPDTNRKYRIADRTGEDEWAGPDRRGPAACAAVPAAYQDQFRELLSDYEARRQKHYRVERALTIDKPYVLVNPGEKADPEDATDLITLGNVYFSGDRSLAAVYAAAYCGSLCGYSSWHILRKMEDGSWKDQAWQTCFTVA